MSSKVHLQHAGAIRICTYLAAVVWRYRGEPVSLVKPVPPPADLEAVDDTYFAFLRTPAPGRFQFYMILACAFGASEPTVVPCIWYEMVQKGC